jgi:hypothetical protein
LTRDAKSDELETAAAAAWRTVAEAVNQEASEPDSQAPRLRAA